jgi:hypothetical protein
MFQNSNRVNDKEFGPTIKIVPIKKCMITILKKREKNTRPSLPFHYISKMMVMIHTPNMPMTMFPAAQT